ncbi:TonB-dependent receptor [Helicobacter sp. MIT 21-1697]|uniref:TonB-dependent receptor n=1 Tax=Helicobacter sp. MIT 21-1697 TaxID=2993733 RepID=UPI00224B97ED|nr:TonB-dependent receptor [Helicobacter sp. MIT 21-1697]MCX2716798.1 TonB-dependent receptor [Helicobacter sp. MIT 21-1697]
MKSLWHTMANTSFALSCCLGGGLYANEVYDLGRIEISSKKVDSNATLGIITSKDIANTASNDVAAALRYTPGVFYQPPAAGRGEPTLGIRGYSTIHIGMFIDGIPVHSVYDRQSDWSQLSSFSISEINVSKGYTSPIYGVNTLGGAVNIITSKPKDKLELTAKYNFISNNENQAALSFGSNVGKVYYQLSYTLTDRDSLSLSSKFKTTQLQPTKDKVNSNYKNHTLRAKLGFELNENHEYSVNFIYQKGEKGGMMDANGTSTNWWNWPNYDKITAYILGNSTFNDVISLNSKLYYDSFDNRLKVIGAWNGSSILSTTWASSSVSPNQPYISHYDDYSLGLIETLSFDFDESKNLKVGLNLKQDNHNNTLTRWNTSNTFTRSDDKLKDISTSLFAEYAHTLNDTFRLAINGSYDRNDMLKVLLENVEDKTYSIYGWTLQGIVYANAGDYTRLHANIGRKSKLLTLKERYSSMWGNRVANPNLQNESAINYELGVDVEIESTKISLAGFYNDLNNMLISVNAGNNNCPAGSNCVKLDNVKEGYSYGVEFAFKQGFLDEKIVLNANYTYVERKTSNASGSSFGVDGSRILDYPNHIANTTLVISSMKQFDVIGLATFQSKQWYGIGSRRAITSYGQNNDIFLLDVKANYRPIESLQFSLGAYNLLDRNYFYGSGYYMAGRRIMAEVKYRF